MSTVASSQVFCISHNVSYSLEQHYQIHMALLSLWISLLRMITWAMLAGPSLCNYLVSNDIYLTSGHGWLSERPWPLSTVARPRQKEDYVWLYADDVGYGYLTESH